MPRESAFRPKGEAPRASKEKKESAPERLPLEPFEKERERDRTFSRFIAAASNGGLSRRELNARLNPKFVQSNTYRNDLVLADGQGTVLAANGAPIYKYEADPLPLLPEQVSALGAYLDFRDRARERQQTADAERAVLSKLFVLGRTAPLRELQARLNPKFVQSNTYRNDLVLTDGQGTVLAANGAPIYKYEAEDEKLPDKRLEPFLIEAAARREAWRDLETRASDSSNARTVLSRLVLRDQVSSRELRARLNPKFVQSNTYRNDLVLADGQGVLLAANGAPIYRYEVEATPLSEENKRLISELFELTKSQDVPRDLAQNLARYMQGRDPAERARMEQVMRATQTEEKWKTRVDAMIQSFSRAEWRDKLQQQVYAGLARAGSSDAMTKLLTEADPKTAEEQTFVGELAREAVVRRRMDAAADFTNRLNRGEAQTSLPALKLLLESADAKDRELARLLVEQAYRAELAKSELDVLKRIVPGADARAVLAFINGLPVRPTVDSSDYVSEYGAWKKEAETILLQDERNRRRRSANDLRAAFREDRTGTVLRRIQELPDATEEETAIKKQLFEEYRSFVAAERPGLFDLAFKTELAEGIQRDLRAKFNAPELGQNREAFARVRDLFKDTLFPLGEAFRDDPRTKKGMDAVLRPMEEAGKKVNPALRYVQRISRLETQRPLTDTERMYLRSVELLSSFNPYLAAVANTEPGVTQEYLNHHFRVRARETLSQLKDGDYVPLIQVGLGPNGLASLGEVMRNNPALAAQMLVVDEGTSPGGPFAIPRGAAWELNSANRRGVDGVTMPSAPGPDELKTVRAYGSPATRWYPGERKGDDDVRQGSINTTVDWSITPDDLSNARYPTNEELHLVLSLQASMLVDKLALQTRVLKEEPNPNPDDRGEKIVTLEVPGQNGERRVLKLKTDGVFIGAGLGEPTYGFRLEGSRAKKIVESSKKSKGFPKLSTTLEAFGAFADRSKERRSPGKTLVIWGSGNSTDTLVEFVGSIFQGDNPLVRNVTKVYVVADRDLSARPRYAQITDLKPRNGRGNLIEFVRARVSDVDYAPGTEKDADRPLVFFGSDGQPLKDAEGNRITADAGISGAGFRPTLDKVLAPFLKGKPAKDAGPDAPLQPLTLPTNPDIAVAETLKDDPNTLLLGTASKPRFDSVAKLAQLPEAARLALTRNGAENAVAIGFRAPDTQAAVNIWLNSREIKLPAAEARETRAAMEASGGISPNTSGFSFERTVPEDEAGIPNNVSAETLMLSPLLAYEVGRRVRLTGRDAKGERAFRFRLGFRSGRFDLRFVEGAGGISDEFYRLVRDVAADQDFQRYALSALGKRRRNPELELNLSFENGVIKPRETFVQET